MTGTEAKRDWVAALPAVRAVVLGRKVWLSVGFLAFWGLVNVLIWLADRQTLEEGGIDPWALPPFEFVLIHGVGIIGGVMLLFGLYGALSQTPKTMLLSAVSILFVSGWNFAVPLVLLASRRAEPDVLYAFVLAAVQLGVGLQEMRRYRRTTHWLEEVGAVTPEQHRAERRFLKRFVRLDESFEEGRVRVGVRDRTFLSGGRTWLYRGQIDGDVLILISRHLADCLCIFRDEMRQVSFGRKGSVKMRTEQGPRQLTFGPASSIAVKLCADLPVTEGDIAWAAKARKATGTMLQTFLASEHPAHRLAALAAVKGLRDGTDVGALAARRLADEAPAVRALALSTCVDAKVDGHLPRAVELLADGEASVRAAAAAYITAFPGPEARQALDAALANETDRKAAAGMKKAAKALDRLGANPYEQA